MNRREFIISTMMLTGSMAFERQDPDPYVDHMPEHRWFDTPMQTKLIAVGHVDRGKLSLVPHPFGDISLPISWVRPYKVENEYGMTLFHAPVMWDERADGRVGIVFSAPPESAVSGTGR